MQCYQSNPSNSSSRKSSGWLQFIFLFGSEKRRRLLKTKFCTKLSLYFHLFSSRLAVHLEAIALIISVYVQDERASRCHVSVLRESRPKGDLEMSCTTLDKSSSLIIFTIWREWKVSENKRMRWQNVLTPSNWSSWFLFPAKDKKVGVQSVTWVREEILEYDKFCAACSMIPLTLTLFVQLAQEGCRQVLGLSRLPVISKKQVKNLNKNDWSKIETDHLIDGPT